MKIVAAVVSAAIAAVTVSACSTKTATSAPASSSPAVSHSASERATVAARLPEPSATPSSEGPALPAAAVTTQAPTSSVQTSAGCYPLTSGGNCYKPGEFCAKADHGAAGVDVEGKAITCADNDGWRWEAA